MSYNGSGTFNINSAGQPVVSGTIITSTAFNLLTADLATGLSTALTKDGQTTPTANIPMGTYKITGLGAGTAAADAVRLSQLQSGGTTNYITVAGTNTITGTVTPTLTAYATGQQFSFVVAATNTTAVTLNIDSVGAKAITRTGAVALVAGDMLIGQVVIVEYDGTRFQLINGAGTLVVAEGGTGAATLTSNNVLLGNGTSAVQFVAPSTSGNVLTSNGTTWTSAAGFFASGTIMLFAQTAAPTGWTKLVARDNYAIRVVTGTAGNNDAGVGFTTAFASQSVAGTVGGTSITTAQLPIASIFASGANADQGATGSTGRGSGNTHTHSFTGTAINLATNYVDVIQASKN